MSLPTVTKDAIEAVLVQWRDPAYKQAAIERMVNENPHIAGAAGILCEQIRDRIGIDDAIVVRDMLVLQYLCLENQFEAQELERTIG